MARLNDIVERLGRERRVERIIQNIVRTDTLTADLRDLAQIVYLAILQYPEDKVRDLWDHDQINFFITRIILNQWGSVKSPYYQQIRGFRRRFGQMPEDTNIDESVTL